MNWGEFFAMGGYAAFVWPCFTLTIAVLILNVVSARRQHAAARQQALRRITNDTESR